MGWGVQQRLTATSGSNPTCHWRVIVSLNPMGTAYQTSAGVGSVRNDNMHTYAEMDRWSRLIRFVFSLYLNKSIINLLEIQLNIGSPPFVKRRYLYRNDGFS